MKGLFSCVDESIVLVVSCAMLWCVVHKLTFSFGVEERSIQRINIHRRRTSDHYCISMFC
jgi:hypothetical protein